VLLRWVSQGGGGRKGFERENSLRFNENRGKLGGGGGHAKKGVFAATKDSNNE